jgi:uncharacterized membrane protein YbhN (UPF0104 family)
MVGFGLAQRHLVVIAGQNASISHALRTAYTGNAITGSVPFVGAQLGTLFTFRAYRRRGIDAPTVAWMLAITGVLSALAYTVIAGTGAIVSGNPFATRAVAGSSVLLVIGAVGGWAALRHQSLRPRVTRRAVRMVARQQLVTKSSMGEPEEIVAGAFERFDSLRPSRVEFVKVFAYEFVNCIADAACFALCILAVGAGVPWTRLILVWVAGNTAKGVPVTPGGVGFVEGALALALVGSGMHPATATAAALLYRFVSFWMLVGIGWLVVAIRRVDDADGTGDGSRTPILGSVAN